MSEASIAEPVVSASRSMARLLAQPSNRSCADCRVTLVDTSQVYVSASPLPEIPIARYNHFLSNHLNFAPPGKKPSSIPDVFDPPVDPALVAVKHTGGHGVFICAMCAAAHKLLGPTISLVHAVQDATQWTPERVQYLMEAGGNARATTVLEAHLPPRWRRPRSASSIAERLTFIREKYEALAFVLPPTGPFATRAWRSIVKMHPEWKGLWGADLMAISELNINVGTQSHNSSQSIRHLLVDRNAQLPNRLVDHFCVVDYSPFLDHSFAKSTDVSKIGTPEDVLLAPKVTDCFPARDAHEDTEFPEHIGAFVCPEGYRPSLTAQAPTFFTFVLTCADGNRLYGGALRVYDRSYGLEVLRQSYANAGLAGQEPEWLNAGATEEGDVIYLPKCLVILSHYPFFDLWRKVLQALYRIVLIQAPLPIERFIANFCAEVPLPPPGRIQVRFGFTANQIWPIERPPENVLPIANFSFRPLFASLSVPNVMVVMGCLLQETKIALLSRHYALLTPTAEALMSLLFPFRWQGLYIPILPYSMIDVLDSPVPFLLGLHSRYLREFPAAQRPRGVVYVDLDNDVVHLGYDDEYNTPRTTPSLPEKDAAKLKSKLATFAASAYLTPDSNRAGKITQGDEKTVPHAEREIYARLTPDILHGRSRRRDFFRNVDKAYTDSELMQPMTGFLSEQGQYHGGETTQSPEPQRVSRLRNMLKLKSRQSSMSSQTSADDESTDDDLPQESLLDLADPKGFSTEEVRGAFLRFFVTVLKDYRKYMGVQDFGAEGFVSNLNLSFGNRGFVETLTRTQLFQRFIQERRESPNDPECIFFDESINAKINRSKLTALANLGRGGKRATSFIDDKSKKIADIYTPPPPSNLGLVDQTYHYGFFPDLKPELFGKTRKPRKWPIKNSTIRTLRNSAFPERNTVSFAARTFGMGQKANAKPTQRASSKRIPTQSTKSLEYAIECLSRPYATPNESREGLKQSIIRRDTTVSDVTISSDLGWSSEDISSAEEIVLNARRKVSIILQIFVNLQALTRGYICRHPHIKNAIVETAAIDNTNAQTEIEETKKRSMDVLFRLVLVFRARRMLLQSRGAAIMIQTHFRRRRAELVFGMVRQAVARIQARARRWLVQRQLQHLLKERIKVYAPQVFALWKKAHTSLAYRTKFWQFFKSSGLLYHGIVETELQMLLKDINVPSDDNRLVNPDISRLIRQSDCLGLNVTTLRNCTCLEGSSSGAEPDSIRASLSSWSDTPVVEASLSSDTADRVAAERTQIYEKLSTLSNSSPDVVESLFSTFEVSLKDKRRKVTLTNLVWSKFRLADESVKLMVLLFPELGHSTNIKFSTASKKGIRRIRSSDIMPGPLEEGKWAHTYLERRIRKNLAEVASVAMLYLPRHYDLTLSTGKVSSEIAWCRAIASVRGSSNWKDCRLEVMRSFVHREKAPIFSSRSTKSNYSNNGTAAPDTDIKTKLKDSQSLFPDILSEETFPDQ